MTGSAYLGRHRLGPHFYQAVIVGEDFKAYKTYAEQVQNLAGCGMDTGDRVPVITMLCWVNYYHLSSYRYTFWRLASSGQQVDSYTSDRAQQPL